MRKSTRLNDMMIFLNDKNHFNLRDLMQEYGISKSTAIRDIRALEEMGMPIYSEPGRNGRYGVLKNKLLSPIIFSIDEMYALYFAMLTLNAYAETPFHLSTLKLKQKFEMCLSNELRNNIHKMEDIVRFEATKHHNSSPLLNNILQWAIADKVCKITYIKNNSNITYHIQFFNISSSFGQWYATGFDYDTKKVRVFRCDKITSITEDRSFEAKPIKELLDFSANIFLSSDASNFEVHILPKGADLFYKENYPSMQLITVNGEYIIKGFYNKGEEKFIADYFISYGKLIQSIYPIQLKDLINNRISEMSQFFSEL